MRLSSALLLAGTILAFQPAAAQKPPAASSAAGHWEGALVVREAVFEVDLRLDLEPAPAAAPENSALRGTVSLPTQFVKDQPLKDIDFDGKKISFLTVDRDGVASSFQGELSSGGGEIAGTMTESGQSVPFHLTRATAPAAKAAELPRLAADGKELISRFNQDAGAVRLLVVLSPTCGRCRMGALFVNRYILQKISDPRLRVYILWEKVSPQDSPAAAQDAAALIPNDPRLTQLWSEERFGGRTFQKEVGLETSPAWDIFLLFPAGRRWEGAPPHADLFEHGLEGTLPKEKELDAKRLAAAIEARLKQK